MSTLEDPNKTKARCLATMLQIRENMVRLRLECGWPLRADEIVSGVRLSHEEFLYLARMAMPGLNREIHGPSK